MPTKKRLCVHAVWDERAGKCLGRERIKGAGVIFCQASKTNNSGPFGCAIGECDIARPDPDGKDGEKWMQSYFDC